MPISSCDNSSLIRGSFSMCLDDVDLGPTSGEATLVQQNTWENVKHGQSILIVDKFLTEQEYTVRVSLRALTLDRLRVIFGVKEGLNGQTLCFRQSITGCTFPERFKLVIKAPGPGCGSRSIHFAQVAVTQDSVEYMFNQEQLTEIEVEFTAFPDCDGLIGCIHDVAGFIATDEDSSTALVCAEGTIANYTPPTTSGA